MLAELGGHSRTSCSVAMTLLQPRNASRRKGWAPSTRFHVKARESQRQSVVLANALRRPFGDMYSPRPAFVCGCCWICRRSQIRGTCYTWRAIFSTRHFLQTSAALREMLCSTPTAATNSSRLCSVIQEGR